MILPCRRHLFDIPADIAWFNTAYMAAQLKSATAAGVSGLSRKARPWEIGPADFFAEPDGAREAFGSLIGATADDIAIVPSAGYGMTTAAGLLPVSHGQQILLLEGEFPSNHYPWAARAASVGATLRTVAAPADGDWTAAVLRQLDGMVAIAALPHCHWADGGILDLERIGAACRREGTALALDLTQSAGVLPIDVGRVQPDILVAATYKWLLGPYSLGFLYVAPAWQGGIPLEGNWASRAGAHDFTQLVNYTDRFQPGARRFDVGERANFALLPVATAALAQIEEWTPEAIATTLGEINERLAQRLSALGLAAGPRHVRSPHILGLQLPADTPENFIGQLAAQKVYVSRRGNMLRIAPHLHVNEEDCDRLVAALQAALSA